MDLILSFCGALILGICTGTIAKRKGYNRANWTAYGTFLFIVALPTILLLKNKDQ